MNLSWLLRLLPFIGGYKQKQAQREKMSTGVDTEENEFFSGIQSALNSAEAKYLSTTLTGAEREANAFSAEQAELAWQRSQHSADIAWQREFEASNTQYQRKVADLQAAGLNPMMAVSGGSSVPAASVASASGSSSVSPAGANLGDLLNFFSRLPLLKAQKENLEADTLKKEADAAQVSQQVNYFDRISDIRAEGESLANDMKRSEMKVYEQNIGESRVRVGKLIAETNESEKRALLSSEQSILVRAQADNIIQMRPFIQAELTARTSLERQQARVGALEEAYKQGLLDEGAIYWAVRADKAQVSNLELDARIKDFKQSLQDGSLRKSAEIVGDWRSSVIAGLYEALNNATKSVLGKW